MVNEKVSYRISTEYSGILVKEVKSENSVQYYAWNRAKRAWDIYPDGCGVFIGFDPSRPITAEQAKSIMSGIEV
jgi:hypothetical protein